MESSVFFANVVSYIFPAIVLSFIAFVFYTIYSKKGRKRGVEFAFGCKVVENLGEIASYSMRFATKQMLTLMACEKGGEKFLVIEVRSSAIAAVNVTWVKIDDQTLKTINQTVKTT